VDEADEKKARKEPSPEWSRGHRRKNTHDHFVFWKNSSSDIKT
jgi:hypothetical protein